MNPAIWLVAAGGIAIFTVVIAGLRQRKRYKTQLMGMRTVEATIAAPQTAWPSIGTLTGETADEAETAVDIGPPLELDWSPATLGDTEIPLGLADFLVSLGLAEGAVKTLEQYVLERPRHGLYHWLELLEIYRRSNMQTEFEQAAANLRQHYNVAPNEWDPPASATPAPTLESYAHIHGRVQSLWRRASCIEYLNQLLEDNRDGTRSGLPQPVVEEILLLQAILRVQTGLSISTNWQSSPNCSRKCSPTAITP
jgi:hypothetical protein